MNDQPILEDARLLLRPLQPADRDFIFRHFSDPQVTRYLLDEPPLADLAGADELIQVYLDPAAQARCNRWVILLKDGGQPVGTCGFHAWSHVNHRAEIGYDLAPDCWGRGIMSAAVRLAIDYAFQNMQLNRIAAVVYVENEPSARLLGRLGFRLEGCLRAYHCLNGVYYDHNLFSLLRQDWV